MVIVFTFDPFRRIRLWQLDRLVASTPLLEGFEHLALEVDDLRAIHKYHNRCRRLGHLWECESVESQEVERPIYKFNLVCRSCFPHIQSRRTIQSYNLFAISEKDI
jgi:hypothetical protein